MNRGRQALVALGLCISMGIALGGEPPTPPQPSNPALEEMLKLYDTLGGRAASQGVKVKAAYAGLSLDPADPTLRTQLKLPDGFGLTVKWVDEKGPAAEAGVQLHDVLFKLQDQFLATPQQFAALVRRQKPGDKVELTAIRAGESKLLTLTLVEKELLPLDSYVDQVARHGAPVAWSLPAPAATTPLALTPGSIVRLNDDQNQLTLSVKDGKTMLVAKDREGKTIYEGEFKPEAAGLPENIRLILTEFHQSPLGGEFEFLPFGASAQAGLSQVGGGSATAEAKTMVDDGEVRIEVSQRDGKRFLKATTKDGKVLYEGEYKPNDPKVPEDLRRRVERLNIRFQVLPPVPPPAAPPVPPETPKGERF